MPVNPPKTPDACAFDPGEESDLAPIAQENVRVYLNNAATTWPKPDPVIAAIEGCIRGAGSAMRQDGGTGGDLMSACRRTVARFLGAPTTDRLMLLPGCTYALNLAILGLPWQDGDVMVISGLEHHAVSRPARKLVARRGVRLETSPYAPGSPFDLEWLESVLKTGRVRLVATTMASNVTGEVLPTPQIVRLARAHGVLSLVDAAQAAGIRPVSIAELDCDMLAFAGHKGLLGPLGIGGLWLAEGITLETLAEGGTGGDSGKHEMSGSCPSNYEVGSHNLPAIAGLGAGVRWLSKLGVETVEHYENTLAARLRSGLGNIPGLTLWGADSELGRTGVVSFTFDGVNPKDTAARLADEHMIACRAGFHCAPLAHETIGTLPLGGTVRLSPGFFNTEADIDHAIAAVEAVAPSLAHSG